MLQFGGQIGCRRLDLIVGVIRRRLRRVAKTPCPEPQQQRQPQRHRAAEPFVDTAPKFDGDPLSDAQHDALAVTPNLDAPRVLGQFQQTRPLGSREQEVRVVAVAAAYTIVVALGPDLDRLLRCQSGLQAQPQNATG